MDSIRQNKVARLIQRDLSEMFQQECKEYTEGAMLSVTAVRVSPDLSYAKIYVSIFPSERVEAVMKSLEEKNKSIRFILGKKVGKQMRIVPELRFFVDDSLDYIDKIDELLKLFIYPDTALCYRTSIQSRNETVFVYCQTLSVFQKETECH